MTNHSELAYQLERIAKRERGLHRIMGLPTSDCGYLEQAAEALNAIAIEAQRAVTTQIGTVRSTKARAESIAQTPVPSSRERK